jgi:hypothetical protein
MTLLTDIVKALHSADLVDYSVHASAVELPGAPDLVVTVDGDGDEEGAATALSTAGLPISQMRRVGHGVIHVWQRPPSD